MATWVILSRFSPQAFEDPADFRKLASRVSEEIRKRCPGVRWKESFAVMGPYDVLDLVEADDPREVERAAMIIRGYGRSTTETLHATPWKEFLETL